MDYRQVQLDPSASIAPNVTIIGDVAIGKDCSIFSGVVIRAESPVRIGEGTNIQDNSTLHASDGFECVVGKRVTVGHNALVHACTVGDDTLIGMSSTVLTGAKIGSNCVIGAGALVTEHAVIPDNSLVVGVPGKIKREVTPDETAGISWLADCYIERGRSIAEDGFHLWGKDVPANHPTILLK
ncbi:MAG: gamma carbonic anhydrase family protein [Coriobacteriales bacterium]|jgi:carbonic anhydrase/acetyltransferase-like protein (isoleucine patch superfamily)|nr:gamma carbonic anhydrase family protein [Coriobacteriales bacterium]